MGQRSSLTDSDLVYTGIGSRRTPAVHLGLMTRCAFVLCERGWVLRSGGADGADKAFEAGAKPTRAEIYYPWPSRKNTNPYLDNPKPKAFDIAALYHPAWPYLRPPVRKLMARNVHQILGRDLDHPVKMVICYTPDGSLDGRGPDSGGTGMALRVAAGMAPDALVFNIAREDHRDRIQRFCEGSSRPSTGSSVG